jgi:RES domain-containing protein
MKPLPLSAYEGRANPKGIPCLYLATTGETAMSEVRPWLGALVSVATFEVVRPLSVVDCSVLHDQYFNLAFLERRLLEPIPPEKVDQVVWAAIDGAFAEPVTRTDDTADYAATQTIAELFRSEGYDGVVYKSVFVRTASTSRSSISAVWIRSRGRSTRLRA